MIKRDNKSLSLKQTTQFLPLRYLSSFLCGMMIMTWFLFILFVTARPLNLFIIENLCLRFDLSLKGDDDGLLCKYLLSCPSTWSLI